MSLLLEKLEEFNRQEEWEKNHNKVNIDCSKIPENLYSIQKMLQNIQYDLVQKQYILKEQEDFLLNKQKDMAKIIGEIEEKLANMKETSEVI